MKNIKLKHILGSIVAIYACVLFSQLYTGHYSSFDTVSKKYLFLFKDSAINKIDTINYSWIADQDILNNYLYYDDKYIIGIWEFKTLQYTNLEDVFINKHSIISNSEFRWQETLDSKGAFPISIKYLYKIDGMILNLGEHTKIIKELIGKSYKGFYGLVNKMSICDKAGKPQIYFNYSKKQTPIVLLLYKGHNSFYLIVIYPNNELYKGVTINENIINILNLD